MISSQAADDNPFLTGKGCLYKDVDCSFLDLTQEGKKAVILIC
jgi:hypothetical protein